MLREPVYTLGFLAFRPKREHFRDVYGLMKGLTEREEEYQDLYYNIRHRLKQPEKSLPEGRRQTARRGVQRGQPAGREKMYNHWQGDDRANNRYRKGGIYTDQS